MHQNIAAAAVIPADELDREWALFQAVESGRASSGSHVWEAPRPVVVVGRSTSIPDHVVEASCRQDGVEIVRRFSGGGAVVLGPGCLNYAVALSLVSCPEMIDVPASFALILEQIAVFLNVPGTTVEGADLAVNGRKVSGNAQRRGRSALIHHGTLLYNFDVAVAQHYLKEPVRQPAYRARRVHREFMGNLPCSRDAVRVRVEAALEAVRDSPSLLPNRGR